MAARKTRSYGDGSGSTASKGTYVNKQRKPVNPTKPSGPKGERPAKPSKPIKKKPPKRKTPKKPAKPRKPSMRPPRTATGGLTQLGSGTLKQLKKIGYVQQPK